MEKITTLVVDGSSYALSDPTRLPQPEDALVGGLLQVKTLENGTVSQVTTLMPETISGKVKTVNGAQPDEDGNIDVASTCDLEQPRWGSADGSTVTEVRMCDFDRWDGYYISVTPEEYAAIIKMEWYDGAEMAWVEDDLQSCEYSEDTGMLTYGGMEFRITIVAKEKIITKIPAQYLDIGDIAAALDHIIALQEELMA